MTDDSDINFILGYIIVNSEGVENSNSDRSSSDEIGLTYADEPLADEEWLANYNQQEKERLDTEEMLGKRLNGSVGVREWLVL
jgi:hypothetical protein